MLEIQEFTIVKLSEQRNPLQELFHYKTLLNDIVKRITSFKKTNGRTSSVFLFRRQSHSFCEYINNISAQLNLDIYAAPI